MEGSYYAPPHEVASRPSMGFPLGTAVLLIAIFSFSAVFSCCYHWDKLRSLRRSFLLNAADLQASGAHFGPHKPIPLPHNSKQTQKQTFPVLMPGDEVPKFLALPCPCQPPRSAGEIVVNVQPQSPPPPLLPPKPFSRVEAVEPFH